MSLPDGIKDGQKARLIGIAKHPPGSSINNLLGSREKLAMFRLIHNKINYCLYGEVWVRVDQELRIECVTNIYLSIHPPIKKSRYFQHAF